MEWELRAQLAPWANGVEFCLYSGNSVATDLIINSNTDPNIGVKKESLFKLSRETAQILIDDLWNCGFRPSEGSGSAGALAATQRHLEDMRKLVFEK